MIKLSYTSTGHNFCFDHVYDSIVAFSNTINFITAACSLSSELIDDTSLFYNKKQNWVSHKSPCPNQKHACIQN